MAFERVGHDAWSCDLLPSRVQGKHIQADVLTVLNDGWDMMIAHPPCTYLSAMGARWLYAKGQINQERFQRGLEATEFFLTLYNANIPKIVVENPTPLRVWGLPPPSQVIQPYQFGHPYSKRTLLWLKGLPPLTGTQLVSEYRCFARDCASGSKKRSKTFDGIAEAMAQQWG